MRTIDPTDYKFLGSTEQDTINEWLEANGIDYKEVRLVTLHDDGTAVVSRWDTNWKGDMPRINREHELPSYDTTLGTHPTLGGTSWLNIPDDT